MEDEPSSSQERESSQPPQAVMVNTSVDNFTQEVPEMAIEWEFELDVFQKQAILHLENKQSVFVSAHTSAGKTVVAEYAIALSLKHGNRAIYTSPIKALSNQKYWDFKQLFGADHVGLQTGDAQLNDKASCVIMTTEILRSKLYDQDLHDLEWVIIDEVQYIGDKTRGVVWEEVLIMLPDTVNLVLLSATFSNTMEFANWVVYERARAEYENQKRAGLRKGKQKNQYLPFVSMVLHRLNYLPAIVFTFARAKCRDNALTLQCADLTNLNEKSEIEVFLTNSLESLSDANRKLFQITELNEMLKRGIAYHHSGVLPRMKEIVEHLFQKGLVKVLFATETFASGVNMPARTVIFDSINEKYDGKKRRTVNSGEYIQMAGRAGRRGKDDRGFSIILCGDRIPKVSILKSLQQGKPCPVESQFHLKDSMILNLLNRAKFRVQDILRQSFAEYSRDSTEKELLALKHQLNDMEPVPCGLCKDDLEQYYNTCKRIHTLRSDLQSESILFPDALPIGRVVVVNSENHKNHFGIIISKVTTDSNKFKAIVICDKEASMGEPKTKLKVPMILKTEVFLPESDFSQCSEVVELDTADFTITDEVLPVGATPGELAQSRVPSIVFTEEVVLMIRSLHTKDISFFIPQTVSREMNLRFKERENLEKQVFGYKCLQCKHLHKHYEIVVNQQILKEKIAEVGEQLSQRRLLLLPQFEQRQKVLKSLNYLNDNMEVQPKGIVACNFSHHELILTEIIFADTLSYLEPEEIAAVLSCIVYRGKQPEKLMITETIHEKILEIQHIAMYIAGHELKHNKEFDVKDYVEKFKTGFAYVVFEWASGGKFEDIIDLAGGITEGEIVGTIQQLINTCREIHNACNKIGNSRFAVMVNVASDLLKRDIFAVPSLYTQ